MQVLTTLAALGAKRAPAESTQERAGIPIHIKLQLSALFLLEQTPLPAITLDLRNENSSDLERK